MKGLFIAVVLASICILVVHSSIPAIGNPSSLRFREVTEELLADNSVTNTKLQNYAVGTSKLMRNSVTNTILAPGSVYNNHLTPNSVTSLSAAIDVVQLHWDSTNVVPAQINTQTIPDGAESVQPVEGTVGGDVVIDNPSRDTAYIIEGVARGPGVILGWYPTRNGHLLRYQSARALRAITCADVAILDIRRNSICSCNTNDIFDGGVFDADCSCTIDIAYQGTDFIRDLGDPSGTNVNGPVACGDACTAPADVCALGTTLGAQFPDPACLAESDFSLSPQQPDACASYTSVEDVNNPQEGIPIYAPSVESIAIDDTGVVTLNFFGRGIASLTEDDPEIDINVVVLLDEQYGA